MNNLQNELEKINTHFNVNDSTLTNNFKTITLILNQLLQDVENKYQKLELLQQQFFDHKLDQEKIEIKMKEVVEKQIEEQDKIQNINHKLCSEEFQEIINEQFTKAYNQFDNQLKDIMYNSNKQFMEQQLNFEQQFNNQQLHYQSIDKNNQQSITNILDKLEYYVNNLDQLTNEINGLKYQITQLEKEIQNQKKMNYCTYQDISELLAQRLKDIKIRLNDKLKKIDVHFNKDTRLETVIIPQINQKLLNFQETIQTKYADKLETQKRLAQLQEQLNQEQTQEGSFVKRSLNWSCASCDRNLDMKVAQNYVTLNNKDSPEKAKSKFGITIRANNRLTESKIPRQGRQNSPRMQRQSLSLNQSQDLPNVKGYKIQ